MSIEVETRAPEDSRSLRDLINDVIDDSRNLVRGEIALARAEMEQKFERLAVAAGSIVGGLVLAFAALNVLLAALVVAIDKAGWGIPTWLAAVIVGGIVAIVALLLVRQGVKALSLKNLVPERTAANVQADARVVRNQL